MDKEEFDRIYSERIDEHVNHYIRASRLDYEYENKPMTLKERWRYQDAINKYRDIFLFENEIFKNFLGETIFNAYSNAFKNLFNGGKQQACYENAEAMKAKGYPMEDIIEITGLDIETVNRM